MKFQTIMLLALGLTMGSCSYFTVKKHKQVGVETKGEAFSMEVTTEAYSIEIRDDQERYSSTQSKSTTKEYGLMTYNANNISLGKLLSTVMQLDSNLIYIEDGTLNQRRFTANIRLLEPWTPQADSIASDILDAMELVLSPEGIVADSISIAVVDEQKLKAHATKAVFEDNRRVVKKNDNYWEFQNYTLSEIFAELQKGYSFNHALEAPSEITLDYKIEKLEWKEMEARMAEELGLKFTIHKVEKTVYKVLPKAEELVRAGTAE